jgi:AraC family transcriptional regulator
MNSMNPDTIAGIGQLHIAQENGELPTTLAAGSAPGESGVFVFRARYRGRAHFSATLQQHLVCFQMSPHVRIECRVAGRALRLGERPPGSLSVCPAGIDAVSDVEGSSDALLVAIDPGQLALAAAEDSALEAQLVERFSGHDHALLDLARALAFESAGDYPNGPLYWNELASGFKDGLVARHTSRPVKPARGTLGNDVLNRLRDYVFAHLDKPVEVSVLAELAGRSPFNFTRAFARSVGMTPHRYVVHLRLQRAIELVRDGRSGLAEIAAHTGFADQSHLSRWVRRVHGVSLTQLVSDQSSWRLGGEPLVSGWVREIRTLAARKLLTTTRKPSVEHPRVTGSGGEDNWSCPK